ncbi:Alpha/Beta hydrolase protein [Chaetomium tenue]|uniref:Alpha/Beta hydrolase protein n=1 Tax=Chaetomium tenue TaxID=1854479 RepID=A0ACB7P8D3_9PEZI|nr:Alpha/Beta hydrolase protein [Chaetomium globosum]
MASIPLATLSGFSDHTFRSTSGVELGVRVWPAETTLDEPAPVVIWTHGGGWIGGFHFAPLPWMVPGFRGRGYHFVSHNYRLAPHARIDEQVADCLEAVSWCRTTLPSILGADKIDVNRYVLIGESAGGHLVTSMGLQLSNPRPKAIVNVYGLVDFLPFPHFGPPELRPTRTTQEPWNGKFSEEELNKLLRDRDQANALTDALPCPWDEFQAVSKTEISKIWEGVFHCTDRVLKQAELYTLHSPGYSTEGLRVGIMHEDDFPNESELMAFVRSVSPYRVLQQRVEQGMKGPELYPPTAFLHGTGDADVPVEQSYAMAELLKKANVPVVESYEEGEPHVFDKKYTGPQVPGWDTYIEPILKFVDQHVRQHA